MGKKKSRSYFEEFIALPDAEKDRIVSEFDREFVADTFGTMSPEARKQWEKAQRRLSARRKSRKKVTITLDQKLVDRSDRLARKQGVSRSQLIARGLEAILKQAG